MPKLNPDIFLQVANRVHRGRATYVCVELDFTPERFEFEELFGCVMDSFRAQLNKMENRSEDNYPTHKDVRELRVMALCLAAAIAAEGDIP